MYEMSTSAPFCRMKISRSSRTTAKKPIETHSPLVLVRLILCWGSADVAGADVVCSGVVCSGAVGSGAVGSGAVGGGTGDWRPGGSSPVPGPVGVGCGSVVI